MDFNCQKDKDIYMANNKSVPNSVKQSAKASSSDKSRKETINQKRLSVRRSIEDYLEDKKQKELYGHLDEAD